MTMALLCAALMVRTLVGVSEKVADTGVITSSMKVDGEVDVVESALDLKKLERCVEAVDVGLDGKHPKGCSGRFSRDVWDGPIRVAANASRK
jgi:hypothetical protein